MRHPFDGLVFPEDGKERTEMTNAASAGALDRRSWLTHLLAASASVLASSLTAPAVPPPQRPSNGPQTPPKTPTTLALKEEGGKSPPPTTQALGEEGNPPPTTLALGEEGNPPKKK